ncbi:MAG: carbohydrate kinase family protein [Geminicoccaceae bacterium]
MTSKRRGILTAGTWCVDRNKLVTHWPYEDGLAEIVDEDSSGGGSACNLAIDIKKLDPAMSVATIGLIGDDADGRLLLKQADRHGIDRSQMVVSDSAPTHYTDAFASKATGRRTHITNIGVSVHLTPDHIDISNSAHRFLHLGIIGVHQLLDAPWHGEANGWVSVLKAARAAGLETNFELAGRAPEKLAVITRPCLPYLDLLIVNDYEIGAITGMATIRDDKTDPDACIEAANAALSLGSQQMVVVHFPAGAIVATREGDVVTRPSIQVPNDVIIGANGAGDAFAAGFLYGLHEGWPLDDVLSLAHAAAAASLRGMSTTAAVEPWQTCLDLARDWGWRSDLS